MSLDRAAPRHIPQSWTQSLERKCLGPEPYIPTNEPARMQEYLVCQTPIQTAER